LSYAGFRVPPFPERARDTYACAVRNAAPVKTFQPSPNTISWGKVFAYALRQPLLATRLGMIYQTELNDLDLAGLFARGAGSTSSARPGIHT